MKTGCALILAAGKGTRMMTKEDQRAKPLRPLLGQPMLYHVLDKLHNIPAKAQAFVLGYQAETVKASIEDYYFDFFSSKERVSRKDFQSGVRYILQTEQLGTGHAVKMAKPWLKEQLQAGYTEVMIGFGDTPTISEKTYQLLFQHHTETQSSCTILSCVLENPAAFGRILRDENREFLSIREAKDCTPEEYAIQEINTGLAIYKIEHLLEVLDALRPQNAQGEYYLTDVPALLKEKGYTLSVYQTLDALEGKGINTLEECLEVEKLLQKRKG